VAYDRTSGEEPRDQDFAPDLAAQPAAGGVNAVLRSVGSLLVTLGAAPRPARRRPRARAASRPPAEPTPIPAELPQPALPDPPRFEGPRSTDDEIELVLADARERANQVIEESVEQARQLLDRRGSGAQNALIERLGDSVDSLSREVGSFRGAVDGRLAAVEQRVVDVERGVTGVYNRLDRIESLLGTIANGESEPTGTAPEPATGRPIPAPRTSSSEPRPRLPATPREAEPAEPVAATPPPPPATPPPPSATEPIPLPAASTPVSPPVNAAETRFDPAGGALVVRVFPISGFQGLMRVQDALARVPTIRAATVETYAQGEARLRLQLGASIASADLATGIEGRLGQHAVVRAASIADRSVLIVVE
jgi:hypothetical protein